jgi:hypothetical protein
MLRCRQFFVPLLQAVLLALPDGYLCREQDGVLKYMLAFREAARAAEWCILMQVRRAPTDDIAGERRDFSHSWTQFQAC